MATSSGTGGTPAEADGPATLAAESELLKALVRLSTADSDAAWQDAVNARNTALRRLLRAVSDLPLDEREIVVTRAAHAAARDALPPPGAGVPLDDGAR